MIRSSDADCSVAFFWQTFTSGNLGVGALAEANLSIAQAAAKRAGLSIKPILFCHSERQSMPTRAGITIGDPMSFKGMLTGRTKFHQQLGQCSLALDIGEGDSFADIYGTKRLLLLTASKFFCIQKGIPLVISPQTIGPFDSWWAKAISNWVMNRATRVFARDGLSMKYLQDNVPSAPKAEVIDVAFRLPFTKGEKFSTDGRIHVGINVSGLLFNGGYTQNNQFGLTVDYKDLIIRLLASLAKMPEVKVHLVGHVIADDFAVEDDYRVISDLGAKHPDFLIAPKFTSPSEAKSYISRLDFFTGARMHACIGAFSSGVPVIPMAYSRKFNGLFNSLGYRHIADLKAHDTDEALHIVLAGLQQQKLLKDEVAAGNALAHTKLQAYEDYLTELFTRIKHDGRH